MKHALIALALLAVPFAHAEKTDRKPASSATFKDGTTIESAYLMGNVTVIQIKEAVSGRTCYGIAADKEYGGNSISCPAK